MTAEVLVVEDEPDIRGLIVHHLAREGFRCRLRAKLGGEGRRVGTVKGVSYRFEAD